jgi:hypothetical protein
MRLVDDGITFMLPNRQSGRSGLNYKAEAKGEKASCFIPCTAEDERKSCTIIDILFNNVKFSNIYIEEF